MISDDEIIAGEAAPTDSLASPADDEPFTMLTKAGELERAQGHTAGVPVGHALIDSGGPPMADGASSSPLAPMGLTDTRSVRARRWSPLESITVRGFKATEVATIPLDRVTILVGPNGCGKSSVLQAIHWAARAASYVLPKNTKEMISFERLDYVPSSEPLTTLHNGELRSDATSTPVEVVFTHRPIGEETVQATIRIRAARNRGGITAYMDGGVQSHPTSSASNSSPLIFRGSPAYLRRSRSLRSRHCAGRPLAAMPAACCATFCLTFAAVGWARLMRLTGAIGSPSLTNLCSRYILGSKSMSRSTSAKIITSLPQSERRTVLRAEAGRWRPLQLVCFRSSRSSLT